MHAGVDAGVAVSERGAGDVDAVGAEVDGAAGTDEVVDADAALWSEVEDAGVGVGAVVLRVVGRAAEGWVFVVCPDEAAGGLAPEGEAAGAAANPLQKIGYMTGKSQIMGLLGRYRDRKRKDFRLGAFHDELVSYGSLPLTVIEWLMLDDPTPLESALR